MIEKTFTMYLRSTLPGGGEFLVAATREPTARDVQKMQQFMAVWLEVENDASSCAAKTQAPTITDDTK